MHKGLLRSSFAFVIGCTLLSVQSCKKENNLGIDNDKVIKTPYSLYAATDQGWMLNTTDGHTYNSIFPADGFAPLAIVTSGPNLMFVKNNLHLSDNNGKNFNPVYYNVRHQPWQQMIVDAPKQGRMYITSTSGRGIAYSEDRGKTWVDEDKWHSSIPTNLKVNSFAATADGAVYAFSNESMLIIKKSNANADWEAVIIEGMFPTDLGEYYLSTNATGTSLFLADYDGKQHVWHSEDGGAFWYPYYRTRMPVGKKVFATAQANGGPWLVGTDSAGVYRAEGDYMVPSSGGLESNTSVYSMVVKRNIYKNDVVNEYIFIATNNGIYRSEDKGYTWDKMTFNTFERIYKAMY
jgi:hypothetical protein